MESREGTTDRLRKRDRISKSLMFSDDEDCHLISQKINECKKFQREHRKKTKVYEDLSNDIGIPIDVFKDVKGYVGKYINNKRVCQSLWCPHCRKFVSKMYEQRVIDRLSERLLPSTYTNDHFHHLSGVLGVCDVDEKEVLKLINGDTNRWRRIRYRVNTLIEPKDCPFIETVYEFELVNWTFLRNSTGSDFKKKQIQQILNYHRYRGSTFLFVHFHSITNLTRDQIEEVFRKEYFIGKNPLIKTNPTTGLYIQNFHKNKTLIENIKSLCSYPFKDPHRFKHSFRGSDYLNGEYFEYEELSSLIKVYQRVQKRNWKGLFRRVDHLRSLEFLKYKKLFPSDHQLWKNSPSLFGMISERKRKDQIDLENVWMVDPSGNVYTEGWNPNFYFPNGLEFKFIQRNKQKIGRSYFLHPHFPWLEIYKNIYEYGEDSYSKKKVKIENFFYPKECKFLGKDEFIGTNQWGNYVKDIDTFGISEISNYFRNLKIVDVHKIPIDIEFDITDPLIFQRLENLKKLNDIDRNIYFRKRILERKK